jgi:hypothetical protein
VKVAQSSRVANLCMYVCTYVCMCVCMMLSRMSRIVFCIPEKKKYFAYEAGIFFVMSVDARFRVSVWQIACDKTGSFLFRQDDTRRHETCQGAASSQLWKFCMDLCIHVNHAFMYTCKYLHIHIYIYTSYIYIYIYIYMQVFPKS